MAKGSVRTANGARAEFTHFGGSVPPPDFPIEQEPNDRPALDGRRDGARLGAVTPTDRPLSKLSFWTGTRPGLETLALVSVPALALGGVIGAVTGGRTGFYASFALLAVGTFAALRLRRRRANAAPTDKLSPPE